MKTMALPFLLLMLLVAVTSGINVNISAPYGTDESASSPAVTSVATSLRRLLGYLRRNYQQVIDVDTAISLRVIEGQTKLLVDEYERGELEFVDGGRGGPMKSVFALGVEARKVANMVVPHVYESDRKRFLMLRNLVETPFMFFHPHRVVNPSLRWAESSGGHEESPSAFNEDIDCLGEIMSASQTKKNSVKMMAFNCAPTANCLANMIALGQRGHRLQRQIFYTILTQRNGCERQVNEYLVSRTKFRDVEQVQHELCTNAYYELEEATVSGIPPAFRDLFLEMEFFCPSVGYFQFMKMEWLEQILSWQSEDGCFPKKTSISTNVADNFDHVEARRVIPIQISENNANTLSHPKPNYNYAGVDVGEVRQPSFIAPTYQQPQWQRPAHNHLANIRLSGDNLMNSGRVTMKGTQNAQQNGIPSRFNDASSDIVGSPAGVLNRRLKTVVSERIKLGNEGSDDCLSHFTSMASSALSLYLRYLLDPGPPEFLHLRLENYLKRTGANSGTSSRLQGRASMQMARGGPTIARPSVGGFEQRQKVDIRDMISKARNFMGTYQRQWGPRFKSIDRTDGPLSAIRLPDYVHRAEVHKELVDWTVSLAKTTEMNEIAATGSHSATTTTRDSGLARGKMATTEKRNRSVRPPVQMLEIHPILQRDLDNYLVIVAIVSAVCLFAFLRYFGRCRRRPNVTIATLKARHL